MATVQQPDFSLFYGKTNITADIEPSLLELCYTDHLEGQSDELSVTFEDIDGKWIRQWFPTQGDKLQGALGYKGEPLTDIGSFEIDEIEYDAMPSVISIRALSTGIGKANRTLKPKAYENTTLAQVVAKVASQLKLKLVGTIKNIPIKRITQYQERDVEFLARLAREYHHSFKIVGDQLVFTDKAELEQSEPVASLDLTDVISLRLRDRIKDTAKAVEIKGYDANGKKVLKGKKNSKALRKKMKQAQSASGDTLKITTRGETAEQMTARGEAALDEQNEDQSAGDISLVGNPKLVAGSTILLTNLGVFSGKYLIKSSRHSLRKNGGYTTDIEVRMLEFIPDDLQTLVQKENQTNATTSQSSKEEPQFKLDTLDGKPDLRDVDDRLLKVYKEDYELAQKQRKETGMTQ